MKLIDVTRTYLELTSRAELVAAPAPWAGLRVERIEACTPGAYRQLYRTVGDAYHWVDRRDWDDDRLAAHLARADVSVWVLRDGERTAGWFELVRHHGGAVEIAYFGLLPEYIGRGLGKYLLTECVHRAWQEGAQRVWLHTCSLDAESALPNYLGRGFVPFHQETYRVDLDG